MDALVQRLVQNPHDQEAILYAHSAGQADPRSYAMLLEKVGTATSDPALASHWLTEAANVWVMSLNDAHRAARALMIAIDRDPTQPAPAERLAELYREKGDSKALAALLERRAKALAALAQHDPNMRAHVAGIHEELGRLWSEAPLSNPAKAIENYRRAIEYDPGSVYSIYAVREALKAAGQTAEAVPYYAMEQALVDDPERKLALYQDEAEARKNIGDFDGALVTMRHARQVDPNDPGLKQQLGTLVLDRVRNGEHVDESQKAEAAQAFVELAEDYQGEHGFAYSTCALEVLPGHDRAVQLAMHYGGELGRLGEISSFAASYLKANPNGPLAHEARRVAGDAPARATPAARPARAAAAHAPARPAMVDRTNEDLESIEEPSGVLADGDEVAGLLAKAQQLAAKNRRNEAAGAYMDVLKGDPTNPDALAFLQSHLRQTRKYAQLRDVLLTASRAPGASTESRLGYLREVAALCETQLRDLPTAILAWQQITALEPSEHQPREQLKRLLERAGRWDDLGTVLEQEAAQTADLEARIATEKQLAKLHELKRKDVVAAGEAWARIASLTPDDDVAIATAVRLFEKGERVELAAQVISDNVGSVSDENAKGPLYKKLGELRQAAGDATGAGEAFAQAAQAARDPALWEAAERCYVEIGAWEQAATAINERAQLLGKPKEQAALFGKEADYLTRAGDAVGAIARLEQATDLDPVNDEYAQALEENFTSAQRFEELAGLFVRRADKLPDKAQRVALRKRAAKVQRESLGDPDAARESLEAVLTDGDDAEALSLLADDAEERNEHGAAVEYLSRLAKIATDKQHRALVTLRQARLLAEGLDDLEAAVEKYEIVLQDIDPKNEDALRAIANLEERRGNLEGTAQALERHLKVAATGEVKVELAGRLADLYENQLDRADQALRALTIVHDADPDDFDAVQRIVALADRLGEWPVVAAHLAMLIEVEGDEEEVSRMTRRRAEILHEKLGRGEEALQALEQVADGGDELCRDEFVKLGDALDKKAHVADKLVEWYRQAPASEDRDDRLHGAFARYVEVGKDDQAANLARDLARMRAARREIADALEQVSVRLKDLEAISVAHELIVRDLSGPARAEEMVRQAEVLTRVGVDNAEASQHGEQALTSVGPDEVEPLLERLAGIAPGPEQVVEIYERQVSRCKAPADRLRALARAAQVAAERGLIDRARGFFDLSLSGAVNDETLEALETAAMEGDLARNSTELRWTLARAMSGGGQGARDGGRTRGALLRRAAELISRELDERDQAFTWLGDGIIAHVEDVGLDALEQLSESIGEPKRAEAVLSRALEEVFDGPLVRKLLARRAGVRAERLGDKRGAAEDLKRLHDLSPSDTDVMQRLSDLYTELEDYRGMVQLYEDQILRGRDQSTRAELARKVARLWEEYLQDPREAADAWRRVLRMKAGDAEATEGLERAKSNMLKKREDASPDSDVASVPPPAAAPARPIPKEPAPEPDTEEDPSGESPPSAASADSAPTSTNAASPIEPGTTPGLGLGEATDSGFTLATPPPSAASSRPPPPALRSSRPPPPPAPSRPPAPVASRPPPPPPGSRKPAPPPPPPGGGVRRPPPPPVGARGNASGVPVPPVPGSERPSEPTTQVGRPPGMLEDDEADVVVDEELLED